jgi:hypothetical protein
MYYAGAANSVSLSAALQRATRHNAEHAGRSSESTAAAAVPFHYNRESNDIGAADMVQGMVQGMIELQPDESISIDMTDDIVPNLPLADSMMPLTMNFERGDTNMESDTTMTDVYNDQSAAAADRSLASTVVPVVDLQALGLGLHTQPSIHDFILDQQQQQQTQALPDDRGRSQLDESVPMDLGTP